jgi:hypothetical protein
MLEEPTPRTCSRSGPGRAARVQPRPLHARSAAAGREPQAADAFIADGYAAWAAFGFSFAGWLLAGIVVAGLTGVFKRD